MNTVRLSIVLAMLLVGANAFLKGAPEGQCKDMTPQHGADPQTSKLPYTVSFSKTNKIQPGEEITITIGGPKSFKGFLLQIREGDKAVGSFKVDGKYGTINCHGGNRSAATHNNAADKKDLKLKWKAPAESQGKLAAYVTVVESAQVFWARHKVADLTF